MSEYICARCGKSLDECKCGDPNSIKLPGGLVDKPVNPEGDAAYWRARAEKAEARAERNHQDCDRLLMAGNNLQHKLAVWGYKTAGQTLPNELADAISEYDIEITAILNAAHDAGKDER